MNNYDQILQSLMASTGRKPKPSTGLPPATSLIQIRQFLTTSAGKDATRAAIDRVVALHKTGLQVPNQEPLHFQIIKSLNQSMQTQNQTPWLASDMQQTQGLDFTQTQPMQMPNQPVQPTQGLF